MIWHFVTDSSCDRLPQDETINGGSIRYSSVPFIISADGLDFIDEPDLDIGSMLEVMEHSREASHTSCPAPLAWHDAFMQEGNVIALTISKELSGSYNSALSAREMVLEENPDKKILIINSASTGPGLICLMDEIRKQILAGATFEEITASAEGLVARMETVFALCSFDNLVKNGRMPRIIGFIARTLGLWGLGRATPEGTISIIGKERNSRKLITAFQEYIRKNVSEPHHIVISHCMNDELGERIREALQDQWPEATVECLPTRGLCSYYAERHGLIISIL